MFSIPGSSVGISSSTERPYTNSYTGSRLVSMHLVAIGDNDSTYASPHSQLGFLPHLKSIYHSKHDYTSRLDNSTDGIGLGPWTGWMLFTKHLTYVERSMSSITERSL